MNVNAVIKLTTPEDLNAIKRIADLCRHELGFVRRSVLERAVQEGRLLVARESDDTIGFVHFRTTRQGICTIYEIGVDPNYRRKGIGRALIEAVIGKARSAEMTHLRLKCPIDLPANGFYAHLGFNRVAIEPGRKRALAIWEKAVSSSHPPPSIFFLTLTNHTQAIQWLLHRWRESGDPRNPFASLIVTPLFVRPSALQIIRELKTSGANVVFDSGGYQVQMGKIRYEKLFSRLLEFYT